MCGGRWRVGGRETASGPLFLSREADVIMTVVEEEMQRGQMGRTQPTSKGWDLGTRKRWESKMAPGKVGGTIQNHNQSWPEGKRVSVAGSVFGHADGITWDTVQRCPKGS